MEKIKELLYSRIEINNKTGCYEWTRNINSRGYGQFWYKGKMHLAHRAMYEVHNNKIPKGLVIRHSCDNPKCCNPNHLIVGSHKENMKDMVDRKRQAKGINNGRSKITPEIVNEIRMSSDTQINLAKKFGISQSQVGRIKRGIHWS